MKPLTKLVVDYIEHEGIEVHDSLSLEIADNLKVGAQDPMAPASHVERLIRAASTPWCCRPACRCRRWRRSSRCRTAWACRW